VTVWRDGPSARMRSHGQALADPMYDGSMGPDILIILIVVLVVVLMWRGPKMLPQIGSALGRTVKDTKAELDDAFKKDDTDKPA
jgi:hypothetical protein